MASSSVARRIIWLFYVCAVLTFSPCEFAPIKYVIEGDIQILIPQELNRASLNEENQNVTSVKLIEGDILLKQNGNRRFKKSSVRNRNQIWPSRTIPYTIDDAFSDDINRDIYLAIEEIQQKTCLTFAPRQKESDWIQLRLGEGCYSPIGRQRGSQELSLSVACHEKGNIMHEFMHALGFWHEQSRYDRDNYVEIIWNNIKKEKTKNFKKRGRELTKLITRYDYESIMHYKANAYAIDTTKLTISPKFNQSWSPKVMGQRLYLSPLDVVKIKKLYNCDISECPTLQSLRNGHLNVGRQLVGGVANYQCDNGLIITGSYKRSCQDNGQWSGEEPVCLDPASVIYCNFETTDLCGWEQDATDAADWIQNRGRTGSGGTGPDFDHTLQTYDGSYMYLEASQPNIPETRAVLISPLYTLFSKRMCLRFSYSMYGTNMGQLNVYMKLSGSTSTSLIHSIAGNQGKGWHVITRKIRPIGHYQFIFEAITGLNYLSDIAIDDIMVGRCDALDGIPESPTMPPAYPTPAIPISTYPTPAVTPHVSAAGPSPVVSNTYTMQPESISSRSTKVTLDYSLITTIKTKVKPKPTGIDIASFFPSTFHCHFTDADGLCGWRQDSNHGSEWVRKRGPLNQSATGSRVNSHCSNGNYMYVETDSTNSVSSPARLASPALLGTGLTCLTFYYKMLGVGSGSLRVYKDELLSTNTEDNDILWSAAGSRPDWNLAQVEYTSTHVYKVILESIPKPTVKGHVAFTDVDIRKGPCIAPLQAGKYNCDFDADTCSWKQSANDDINWVQSQIQSSAPRKYELSGYFLSLSNDTDSAKSSNVAKLVSPIVPEFHSGYCLRFWFRVVGTGNLRVITVTQSGRQTTIWHTTDETGDTWESAEIYLYFSEPYTVIFEGFVNSSKHGDVYVDNIRFVTCPCRPVQFIGK